MALICSNCESHYLIEDYDNRLHYVTGYHCVMCGGTKLIEEQAIGTRHEAIGVQNPSPIAHRPPVLRSESVGGLPVSDEGGNMPHKLCEVPGCKKQVVKNRMCTKHYRAKTSDEPRAQQMSYKKFCSVEGCTKQSLAQGVCYQHLTIKCGGVNPYKYPKKKKKSYSPDGNVIARSETTRQSLSAFVEVAPNVLVPKETKVLVDQINALQSLNQSLSVISRKETITMKVRGEEGGILSGRIAFTYRNGSPPEFNAAGIEGTQDPLTYDDWMFLGAIAAEIRRIAGEN